MSKYQVFNMQHEAFQNAKTRGQAFTLANVGETPLRVLQLARLDQVFIIHETVDAAVNASG